MSNLRLNKASQVKRLIANTINQLQHGEIEENKARVIGYLAQVQLKAIEVTDLESKIEKIEDLMKDNILP